MGQMGRMGRMRRDQGKSGRIKPNQTKSNLPPWPVLRRDEAARRAEKVPRRFQWNPDALFIKALNEPSANPEGIESLSPGLARFREGLPWVKSFPWINPEGVAYQVLRKQIQPFQGRDFSEFSPRVARSSQPWAKGFNPFGIGLSSSRSPTANWHSIENSEEPIIGL
jgi:hypothetical protein